MKKYFQRLQEERTPHERRAWAVRAAGFITALFFVGWLATLGARFGGQQSQVAQQQASNPQTAAVGGIIPVAQPDNTLYVATTTQY